MCVILTNGIIGLRKRITAAVLSLVIAFGSLPVISAFAESDEAFKGFSYWSVSGGGLSAVSRDFPCVWRSEHILRGCVYCVVHIIFFYTEKYKKKNLHYFRLHFLLFITQL